MGCFVLLLAVLTVFSFSRLIVAGVARPLPGVSKPGEQYDHREPYLGAVTSASSECSRVGIRILEKGGNAADAIIATEFCLGVIVMYSTGIGGGGFMVIRAANGSYETVDFRETAPAAAYRDMYNDSENASLLTGLASAVPGVLRGLEYLHKNHATLPWAALVEPAIKIALNGFLVDQDLFNVFNGLDNGEFLVKDPVWAAEYAPKGTRLGLGDLLKRERLGRFLQSIAREGPDVFYNGKIADLIVRALQAANGTMTVQDLQKYSVVVRKPVSIRYRDYKITSMGAPGGGSVVLSVLKTIEGYEGFGDPSQLNLSSHRLDEAMRFGYGARTELADPLFWPNITVFQERMLDPNRNAEVRSKISDAHTLPVAAYDPKGLESLETPGTSHVVAADATGMAISLTSTINLWFGSRLMVPEIGLIMNNEMNDFSVPGVSNNFGFIPSPANFIEPGKRPLSSMAPLIIEFLANNTVYYVLGGAGGSHIITSTIQCIWNVLDRNMTTAQALKAPRFHDQLVPDETEFEYNFDNRILVFLEDRGHNVTWSERGSDVQALRRLFNGTFEAASEPGLFNAGGYAI